MVKTIPSGPLHPGMPRTGSRIIVLVVPPVEELDLVGPLQVFSSVNRLAGRTVYSAEIVTNSRELIVNSEGGLLTFLAQGHFQDVKERFDSVLLVCGVGSRTTRDPALCAWLKTISTGVRRLGSVCVGAFLLAEAGLLNGKNATAHWKFGQQLAKQYPKVKVQSDRLWVKDGNVYTSAGISAGIDLALAWVEEDCGVALAHEAARELVLFLRRPGGQQQLSVSLGSQASEMRSIQELQVWITENSQKRFSMRNLAERVSMSTPDLRTRIHQRSWHDAFAIRVADACRSGTAPNGTNEPRSQTDRSCLWIWEYRFDEARLRPAFGYHPGRLSKSIPNLMGSADAPLNLWSAYILLVIGTRPCECWARQTVFEAKEENPGKGQA
jgi:transcriptional regulator GlxA family with amidase domain